MLDLCAPALIYVIFSLTHIIIDTFKGLYNTAFFKFIVAIFITLLLNTLCIKGMSIISWLIVFIPFILMTVIVSILLYTFGLNPETGTLNISETIPENNNFPPPPLPPLPPPTPQQLQTSNSPPPPPPLPSQNSIEENNQNYPPSNYSSDPAYESFLNK